jgi:hypothetical protein
MSAAAHRTGGKGKAARRNTQKNASHVLEYLEAVESAKTRVDLETWMERNAVQIARVTRWSGGGHLKVALQDGSTDVDVTIAGSLRFKGRAATKGDRANSMNVNDLIVLYGPQAAGKIPRDLCRRVAAAFERLGVSTPKGFFGGESDEAEEDLFDRDEEETADALTTAAKVVPRGAPKKAATDSDSEDEVDIDAI